jgi:hypothetical protein
LKRETAKIVTEFDALRSKSIVIRQRLAVSPASDPIPVSARDSHTLNISPQPPIQADLRPNLARVIERLKNENADLARQKRDLRKHLDDCEHEDEVLENCYAYAAGQRNQVHALYMLFLAVVLWRILS